MKLSKYGVFLKVLEAGSFSKAADEIGYTQSAVSQVIAALEKEMDLHLLDRSKHGVSLSSDGSAVFPHIRSIHEEETRLENTLNSMKGLLTGCIKLGTFTSISCHFLPQVIQSFSQKYPLISFEFVQGNYCDIAEWLQQGYINIGFLRLPIEPKFTVIPFQTENLVVVLPPCHPFAGRRIFPADQLIHEHFILLEEGNNEELEHFFRHLKISPKISYRVQDDYTIMSFVERNLGISILPETVLTRTPYDIIALPLDPPLYRKLGIVYKSDASLSTASRLFIQELKDYIK